MIVFNARLLIISLDEINLTIIYCLDLKSDQLMFINPNYAIKCKNVLCKNSLKGIYLYKYFDWYERTG